MTGKIEKMRKDALDIFKASIAAVNPQAAVRNALKREGDVLTVGDRSLNLADIERVFVVGGGKASAAMAQAVEEIVGDRVAGGMVVVKYGHTAPLKRIEVVEAAHPVPDQSGIDGAGRIIAMLEDLGEKDMVISLISGGGSALLPQPAEGMTLADKKQVTQALLDCGATIHEINCIRKHLSRTKGGGMAQAAYPAMVVNLMLSDVVGDNMDVIASGPFVPDKTSYADALGIIRRYGIEGGIPGHVLSYLKEKAESGKDSQDQSQFFAKVINKVVGSNIIACRAAESRAAELGYSTLILSSMIEGNTTDVANLHAAIASEIARTGHPLVKPACVISGGETTVIIKGKGLGGRNQEYALVCADYLAGVSDNIVMLSGGTDGTDGPTDAAGGLADPATVARGKQAGMEIDNYLENNDAYHYLEKTGDLIKTGPTLTNVMDIRILLVD